MPTEGEPAREATTSDKPAPMRQSLSSAWKNALAAAGVMLIVGGTWAGLGAFLPDGMSRTVVTAAMGVVFAGVYLVMLVRRVRNLYFGRGHFFLEIGLGVFNLLLLLATFAAAYSVVGLTDASGAENQPTHAYADAAYFSVVTFTTLGYGDMHPHGAARILACVQCVVGYIVLGVLASVAAEFLSADLKHVRKRGLAD